MDCEEVETDSVHRLGKIMDGKSWPVKATLSTRNGKIKVIKKSRGLRDTGKFKRVYISNDKTKCQQTERSGAS